MHFFPKFSLQIISSNAILKDETLLVSIDDPTSGNAYVMDIPLESLEKLLERGKQVKRLNSSKNMD